MAVLSMFVSYLVSSPCVSNFLSKHVYQYMHLSAHRAPCICMYPSSDDFTVRRLRWVRWDKFSNRLVNDRCSSSCIIRHITEQSGCAIPNEINRWECNQ